MLRIQRLCVHPGPAAVLNDRYSVNVERIIHSLSPCEKKGAGWGHTLGEILTEAFSSSGEEKNFLDWVVFFAGLLVSVSQCLTLYVKTRMKGI